MKPAELLRRLARRATCLGLAHEERPAKGGHRLVRHGGRTTVVPQHRKDLATGTYHAILKQLGLTPGGPGGLTDALCVSSGGDGGA